MIELCMSGNSVTVSTGLRGLRNLVNIEFYQGIVKEQKNFVKILKYLDPQDQVPKYANVYIFEIYFTLLNAKGTAPGEDAFLKKLMNCLADDVSQWKLDTGDFSAWRHASVCQMTGRH